jgi:hypothetical protein
VVANRLYPAPQAVAEYARRPGCEAGFRDAKWWLGFAQARIKQITAWSRLFALFAIALLIVLSLVSAMVALLQQEPGLYDHLVPRLKLKLEGDLSNVSDISLHGGK